MSVSKKSKDRTNMLHSIERAKRLEDRLTNEGRYTDSNIVWLLRVALEEAIKPRVIRDRSWWHKHWKEGGDL